jgi:tape measure domain-containing protein
MATEVGTAFIAVVPSARGFGNRLQREVGPAAKRAGTLGGRQMSDSMQASSGSGFKKIGAAITGIFALKQLKDVAAWGLGVAANNEQATISFTTMLGSAQKAGRFLDRLKKFAAATPFEFPELQRAASSLISAGINADKVIPIMRTLGDVTSGMGTGSEGIQRATVALQQMNAAGRITGEDLNQLRDAGIPVYDLLAKALGKTKAEVVELSKEGGLGQEALTKMMKALETGAGLERFSGLMEKQSASLTGMISTFKDVLGQGLAEAFQPVIPLIKDGLTGATAALGKVLPYVTSGLANFVKGVYWLGEQLAPVVDGVKVFYGALTGEGVKSSKLSFEWIDRIVAGATLVRRGFEAIRGAIEKIPFAAIGAKIGDTFSKIDFGAISNKVGDVFTKIVDAIKGVDWSKIGEGFKKIGASIGNIDFSKAGEGGDALGKVFGFIADHMDEILKALPFLIAGFVALAGIQKLNTIIGRDSLIGFVAQLVQTGLLIASNFILARSYGAVSLGQKKVSGGSAAVTGGFLREKLAAIGSAIATKAAAAAARVMAAAQFLLNKVMGANPIVRVILIIAALVTALIVAYKTNEKFRNIVNKAFGAIKNVAGAVLDWLGKAVSTVIGFIKKHWKTLAIILGGPLAAAVILIHDHWDTITRKFTQAKDWVVGTFKRAWARLKSILLDPVGAARDAINRILDKLPSPFREAVSAIGRAWDALREKAKAPIRFVVNTVINGGLIAAFNKVAGALGSKTHINDLALPPGFARGGYTGAGSKYQPAGIVHADEFVIKKDSRRKLEQMAPGLLDYINKRGALPGYAEGGIVGRVLGKLKDFGSGLVNFFKNPTAILERLLSKIVGGAGGVLDSPLGDMAKGLPGKLVGMIAKKLKGIFGSGGGNAGIFAGSLLNAGRRFGANPISPHIDPQGGSAYDFMIGIPQGRDLAANLVKYRKNYGVRYVIHNMRIWSDVNWAGRPYTPISNTGDFRHTGHVHASYGMGGPRYGYGTAYARPGMALVGEHGPELVRMRGGEQVVPNRQISQGGNEYHAHYEGDLITVDLDQFKRKDNARLRDWMTMSSLASVRR